MAKMRSECTTLFAYPQTIEALILDAVDGLDGILCRSGPVGDRAGFEMDHFTSRLRPEFMARAYQSEDECRLNVEEIKKSARRMF